MKKLFLLLIVLPLICSSQVNQPATVTIKMCTEQITYDTINSSGNIITELILSVEGDSLMRTRYHYVSPDISDYSQSEFYLSGKWFVQDQRQKTFDVNDSLLSNLATYYHYSDTLLINTTQSREEYFYDSLNDSTFVSYSEGSPGSLPSSGKAYKYDSGGRLLFYYELNPLFTIINIQKYSYLNNDSVQNYFKINYVTGDTELFEYSYNTQNLRQELTQYKWLNNSRSNPEYHTLYYYDSSQFLSSYANYNWLYGNNMYDSSPHDSTWYIYSSTHQIIEFHYAAHLIWDDSYYFFNNDGTTDSSNLCHITEHIENSGCNKCNYVYNSIPIGIFNSPANVSFSLFPNPSESFLLIKLFSDIKIDGLLSIQDITGKTISTMILKKQNGESYPVDVSFLASGIYFISLYDQSQRLTTQKFVKL